MPGIILERQRCFNPDLIHQHAQRQAWRGGLQLGLGSGLRLQLGHAAGKGIVAPILHHVKVRGKQALMLHDRLVCHVRAAARVLAHLGARWGLT